MPLVKQVGIKNPSTGDYDMRDVGAEAQNVIVSYDSQGEIIEDIKATGVTVSSTKSTAKAIKDKADKVSGATAGDVATLDANGNLVDSGKTLGKSVPSDAVFTDTNTKVTQTNTTGSADYRLVLSANANDTTETNTARKSTNFKANPSTGVLSTPKVKISKSANTLITGSGTVGSDKGSGVSPRYYPAKWTFNLGGDPNDGDIITIKIPVAGGTYSEWLSTDNGTTYHPIALNGKSRITSQYAVNTYLTLIYESSGVCTTYALAGADSTADITGTWRVINYYDSNTTYSNMSQSEADTGTATTGRIISAKVLTDTISNKISDKTGHVIVDNSGTAMTQRNKLQFMGFGVSDDSTNGKTVVTVGSIIIVKTTNSAFYNKSVTISDGQTTISETFNSTGEAIFVGVWLTGTLTISSTSGNYTINESVNVPSVGGGYIVEATPASATLNDNDWETIQKIAKKGTGANYWSVGDRKAVTINGTVGIHTFNNETYYAYILGFNHNSAKEGTAIHFQFGFDALSGGNHIAFCDSSYGSSYNSNQCFNMNPAAGLSSSSNAGGWSSSKMRTVLIPQFKNALPAALRSVLKAVTKYTDNTGNSMAAATVTTTSDEIFLLAEYEVFGSISDSNWYEQANGKQVQYSYYASGNDKIMKKHSDTSTVVYWWERSPNFRGDKSFCAVRDSGSATVGYSGYSYGFAPGFAVG